MLAQLPSVQWIWSYTDGSGQPLPGNVVDLDALLASHPQYSGPATLQMPASFLRNANFASAPRANQR